MKWLIALLLTCSSVLGQGFGSFTYDQPFLSGGGNPYNPATLNPAYWWVATDNAANSTVSSWKDRVAGLYLVQTNQYKTPTNSSFGICFDGTKALSLSNAISFPRGSSVMIIGYSTPMPHPSQFLFDTNLVTGFYVSANGQWNSQYGSVDHVMSSGNIDFSALNDYFCTTAADGSNMRLVAYTNGVLSTSNYFAQNNDATFHSVGGNENYNRTDLNASIVDEYLYGYIHEILIWTNHVLTASEVTYLHNYKAAQYAYLGSITPFFNPATIAGLGTWLRADGVIGSTISGGPKTNNAYVAYWGNSLNVGTTAGYFTDSVAGTGPKWNPDTGPSGRPALNWGANNIAAASKNLAPIAVLTNSMAQPNTYFFVLRLTNSAANAVLMDTTFGGNHQQFYFHSSVPQFEWYAGTGQNTTYPFSITNWTVLTVVYDGANSYMRTNGVKCSNVPGSVGTWANPVPTIGDYGSGGLVFQGFICESIMYNSHLATNALQSVELALMNKYDPSTNIWSR